MYAEIARLSFKQNSVYRANIILTLLGSIFSIIIQMSLWTALIQNGVLADNVTLSDMIQFTVINSVIATLTHANIESVIAQKMRDGSIGIDFIRPIHFKLFLFSDTIGANLFNFLFCSLPVCVFAIFFYNLSLPANLILLPIFLFSLLLGLIISLQISYIIALIAFWIETVWFISWYTYTLYTLFGGLFIPVWFYPSFLVTISKALPFYYVAFAPISIYTGKETVPGSLKILLIQCAWLLFLLLLEKIVWHRAQKQVTVAGG